MGVKFRLLVANVTIVGSKKMPETIHCSICGKAIRGENFQDWMAKLRRHRKKYHPAAFKRSVKKGVKARKRE